MKQIEESLMDNISGYSLSRNWFDFCFENPEKINPSHTAVYFFAIEHCNRLGWKKKFGFPTTMVMEAVGIKSYNTFKKVLFDLVNFGFIRMIEKSKNQYSANIIALSNFDKATNKALDKALTKHLTKQSESTIQSIVSIDKQETSKQLNKRTIEQRKTEFKNSLHPFLEIYSKDLLNEFYSYWTEHGEKDKKMRFEKQTSFSIERRLATWKKNEAKFGSNQNQKIEIGNLDESRFKNIGFDY